jgi:hypothetical protein
MLKIMKTLMGIAGLTLWVFNYIRLSIYCE